MNSHRREEFDTLTAEKLGLPQDSLSTIVLQLLKDRFEELKALALRSDDPQEELATHRGLLEKIEEANKPRPAPTHYGKPAVDDFDKPGEKWGNA